MTRPEVGAGGAACVPPHLRQLYDRLYYYQKESVQWVLQAFMRSSEFCSQADNCIGRVHQFQDFTAYQGLLLGHSPGLGKTPISSFVLSVLFATCQIRYALIVVPKTLVEQWRQHLAVWCPNVTVFMYSGPHRDRELRNLCNSKMGVLLTTYRTVDSDLEALNGRLLAAQKYFHEKDQRLQRQREEADARQRQMEEERERDMRLLSLLKASLERDDSVYSVSSSEEEMERRVMEVRQKYEAERDASQAAEAQPQRVPPHRHVAFDFMVLDEATEIKNETTQVHQSLRQVKVFFKLALTGTPIMNNIKEMYNLIDFLHPLFLGDRTDFVREYDKPINISRLKDATHIQQLYGQALQRELIRAIEPIFLRRTKEQVSALQSTKTEIILWMNMCAIQDKIFNSFVGSKQFERQLHMDIHEKVMPFQLISCLRKVCENIMRLNKGDRRLLDADSPQYNLLLQQQRKYAQACKRVGGSIEQIVGDNEASEDDYGDDYAQRRQALRKSFEDQYQSQGGACFDAIFDGAGDGVTFEQVDRDCGAKQCVLVQLLRYFAQSGLKTLIFTEHTTTLNLIQVELQSLNIQFLRIDGSVVSVQKRQEICHEFNRNGNVLCLIMTIKVGGFGLNLQGARRVVIFSPNWNPSIEEQAVGRAYRIGQKENVIVYKLLVRNSIEEKLVARQFHKIQVADQVTHDMNAKVQVKRGDIRELFSYRDPRYLPLTRAERLQRLRAKTGELQKLMVQPDGRVMGPNEAQIYSSEHVRNQITNLQYEVSELSKESLEEVLELYYTPSELEAVEDYGFLRQMLEHNKELGIKMSLVRTNVGGDDQTEVLHNGDTSDADQILRKFMRYEPVHDDVGCKEYRVVSIQQLRGHVCEQEETAAKQPSAPVDPELAAIFGGDLGGSQPRGGGAASSSASYVVVSDSDITELTDDL